MVAATLAACGGNQAPSGPTLHSSLQAFALAPAVRMTGSVTYSNVAYEVDLSVDSRRRATGTVTTGGSAVQVQDDGSVVYMQGKDYFGKLLKFPVFDRWVKYPAAPVANLVLQLTDRAGIARSLEMAAGTKVKSTPGLVSGVRTTSFLAPTVTVDVPRGGSARPVEIDTAPAIQAGPDISQLAVHLSDYGVPLAFDIPSKFVDSADSGTWPPYWVYVQGTIAFQNCDNNGCTLAAGFTNNGGKGEGTASVHFLVKNSSTGAEVAGCDAPLPPTDSGGTANVSCHIAYDRSQGGLFGGTFVLHNPTS